MPEAPFVLVVEDDDVIRLTLVEAFALEGYRTSSAASLPLAQASVRLEPVSVVVLDLWLGHDHAESLLEELAALDSAPPVVIVSAAGGEAERVAKRFGLRLVPKPFDIDDVLSAVEEAMQRDSRPRLVG